MSNTNLMTAANRYARRDKDQAFETIPAMLAQAQRTKDLAREKDYNLKELQVIAVTRPDGQGEDLMLASPKGQASMTNWSFGQVCRTVGAPASYLSQDLSPALAASCLNHGIENSPVGSSVRVLAQVGAPPLVRSVTTEKYGRLFDADLIGQAQRQIFEAKTVTGSDWQAPPTWDGPRFAGSFSDRDSFVIQVDGGSIVTDPSLHGKSDSGMYRGIMIRNSEVGASSVVIECVMFRYICGNLIIWGAVISRQFRRRHIGSHVLRDVIREISQISRAWTDRPASADQKLISDLMRLELASTKEGLIDELRAAGASKEQALAAYASCEAHETASPRSFWGIAQGLTRESQLAGFANERYELDKLAGVILAKGARVAA